MEGDPASRPTDPVLSDLKVRRQLQHLSVLVICSAAFAALLFALREPTAARNTPARPERKLELSPYVELSNGDTLDRTSYIAVCQLIAESPRVTCKHIEYMHDVSRGPLFREVLVFAKEHSDSPRWEMISIKCPDDVAWQISSVDRCGPKFVARFFPDGPLGELGRPRIAP
jgi:hypothetical protein